MLILIVQPVQASTQQGLGEAIVGTVAPTVTSGPSSPVLEFFIVPDNFTVSLGESIKKYITVNFSGYSDMVITGGQFEFTWIGINDTVPFTIEDGTGIIKILIDAPEQVGFYNCTTTLFGILGGHRINATDFIGIEVSPSWVSGISQRLQVPVSYFTLLAIGGILGSVILIIFFVRRNYNIEIEWRTPKEEKKET